MADADKCAACGEIIPEGIQVCPLCSKEVLSNEPEALGKR